jgi:GTP cyclohydrolase I
MPDSSVSRAVVDVDPSPQLHVVTDHVVDLDAAARAVSDLLVALGQDTTSDHLTDTPRRVAAVLGEAVTPIPFAMTTFVNDGAYDQMVTALDIPFHSLCAHHLLPFVGVAHIAYVPGDRIVGLSKLARLVEHSARRLQTQEHLTTNVLNALREALAPAGAGVVLQAEHLCMSMRGVRARGAKTVTTSLEGVVRDDPATRAEFLALAAGTASRTTR